MKKAVIRGIFVAIVLLAFAGSAHAASQVYFSIQYQDSTILNRTFNLPDPGTITLIDDIGASRAIDAQSVLAVLYDIQATTNAYQITDLKYYSSFSPPSLYLRCMQVPLSNSACDGWQYTVNGITAADAPDKGMDQYKLNGGETVYVYFADYGLFPHAVDQSSFSLFNPGPIGGSVQGPTPSIVLAPTAVLSKFDVEKAVAFLAKNQDADGSFGNAPMLSDWAAVALGSFQDESSAKIKLKNYLLTNPSPGNLLTDYERRAMALEALGINPYSATSTNYIQKIVDSFDGQQFGDPSLVNDDIFALLVLVPAGYRNNNEELNADISFILKNQKSNGSWGDVDLTASAVQALSEVAVTNDVKDALGRAKAFLISKQEDSLGFGNIYSTSWAMQALASLKENINQKYLQSQQAQDGGVQELDTIQNRIWATSYAIPAAMGKDWGSILNYFGKQEIVFARIAEPKNDNIQALEQKVNDLSLQIAFVRQEIADAQKMNTMKQELAVIAEKANEIQLGVMAFQKEETPKTFAEAPLLKKTALEQSPVDLYGASVGQASVGNLSFRSVGIVLAITLMALGVFSLLGGLNLLKPFISSVLRSGRV